MLVYRTTWLCSVCCRPSGASWKRRAYKRRQQLILSLAPHTLSLSLRGGYRSKYWGLASPLSSIPLPSLSLPFTLPCLCVYVTQTT